MKWLVIACVVLIANAADELRLRRKWKREYADGERHYNVKGADNCP